MASNKREVLPTVTAPTGGARERVTRGAALYNTSLVPSDKKGYTATYSDVLRKLQTSQQLNDLFAKYKYYNANSAISIIEPLYSPEKLIKMYLESNVLRQVIESYAVNIDSYGHALEYIGPEGEMSSAEAQAEKGALEAFLEAPAPEGTLVDLRRKSRIDKEVLGYRAYEIQRDKSGKIVMLAHLPADTLRMTYTDPEAVKVRLTLPDPSDYNKVITKEVSRKFRRYVQCDNAGKKIYFKELGDPRKINPTTGAEDAALSFDAQANEVYVDSIYTPGCPYGAPRWVGVIPSVLGSRESEIVNLNFFRDNAIPAMAVLVSGGALTKESFELIDEYINSTRGQGAMQRVMVLEASSDDTGSIEHSAPAPRIELKPLVSERQQEGLFQTYDQNNIDKIRSAFRAPPLLIGDSADYTKATAIASMLMAESQIFVPERQLFDNMMNKKIFSTYGVKYWRFKSLAPPMTDIESVTGMIDSFSAQGALTPNIAIKVANRLLDADIEAITEAWGDYPFGVIMAYVNQGMVLTGLTEYLVDMKMPLLSAITTGPPATDAAPATAPTTDGTPAAGDEANPAAVAATLAQIHADLEDKMQIFASDTPDIPSRAA